MDRPVTVYINVEGSSSDFTKIGCQSLPSIYAGFESLLSVAANEALLRALAQARSIGIGSAKHGDAIYLFVRDDFPASSMTVPGLTPVMIPTWESSQSGLDRELGRQRIAYTPVFFNGYFVRGDGKTFDTKESMVVPYDADTLKALQEVAGSDFEDCGEFFGDDIVRMAKAAFSEI